LAMLARTRKPTAAPIASATMPTITGIMLPPCGVRERTCQAPARSSDAVA
jgi:hypothetical protein